MESKPLKEQNSITLQIFISLIFYVFYEAIYQKSYSFSLIYIWPFFVSYLLKQKRLYGIILLFTAGVINLNYLFFLRHDNLITVIIFLFNLILDFVVENFPKKLERLYFLQTLSFSFPIIFAVMDFPKAKKLSQVLSASQLLIGSFQAIREYEKFMKKFRTDLGGVYYKCQIIIVIELFFYPQSFCNIMFEFLLLSITTVGIFYRPGIENMQTKNVHGHLMKASYIMVILRNILETKNTIF